MKNLPYIIASLIIIGIISYFGFRKGGWLTSASTTTSTSTGSIVTSAGNNGTSTTSTSAIDRVNNIVSNSRASNVQLQAKQNAINKFKQMYPNIPSGRIMAVCDNESIGGLLKFCCTVWDTVSGASAKVCAGNS